MSVTTFLNKLQKDVAGLTRLVLDVRRAAGGGEANTASNIGAGGVGLYDSKVGVNLRFRNVNAASARVSVALDNPNHEVDVDVVQAQIDHGSIAGLGDDDHNIYLLASGARALTGSWDAGCAAGRVIRAGYLMAGAAVAAMVERLQTEARIALKETTDPVATAGYGKIWVSSVDGLPYFMDDAGNICGLCGGGAGSGESGGGGVTDALYIVGAADVLLPNARVKQALYYNYDLQDYPASPDALDDEFDDSAIDPKWTIVNEVVAYPFNESDKPGFIWFGIDYHTSTYANSLQFYQTAPAGNQTLEFIARVCISNFLYASTSYYSQFAAICLAFINSTDGEWVGTTLQLNQSHATGCTVYMAKDSAGSWSALSTAVRGASMGKFIYLKLQKTTTSAWTSLNSYVGHCSWDGITWDRLCFTAEANKTFSHDVDRVGFIIRPTDHANYVAHGAIDFFRRTD